MALAFLGLILSGLACTRAPGLNPVSYHQRLSGGYQTAESGEFTIRGRLEFPRAFHILAAVGDVVASASVTFADRYGNVIASGLSDGTGAFSISPSGMIPAVGVSYLLEAAKPLGGGAPGKPVARLRTLLQWSGPGWLSISSATESAPIIVNPLTTAVAILSGLDPVGLPADQAIGKVNGAANPVALNLSPVYAGHSDTEITGMASSLMDYLTADQDPIAGVSGAIPAITSGSSGTGVPGELLSFAGTGFVPIAGRNTVRFGSLAAPVYFASPHLIVVRVPQGANASDTVTLTTPFGTSAPFSFLVGNAVTTVDPAGFAGSWAIPGITAGWQRGRHDVGLAVGRSFELQLNGFGTAPFTLDGVGTVIPGAGGRLAGGSRLVALRTATVSIAVGASLQRWAISYVNTWQTGNQDVQFPRNTSFSLAIDGSVDTIPFSVSDAGAVQVSSGAATATGGTLALQTTAVRVDPGGFAGSWLVTGMPAWLRGSQNLSLVRSMAYQLQLSGQEAIPFQLDATGNVTTLDSRATASGATLTLATIPISIASNGWRGAYTLTGMSSSMTGDQAVRLVRNAEYTLGWGGEAGSKMSFFVDGSGSVTSPSPSLVGGSGQVGFNVQLTAINRAGYDGTWSLKDLGSLQSYLDGRVPLLKGQTYTLYPDQVNTQNLITFGVDPTGAVNVYSSAGTGGLGTLTFNTVAVSVDPRGWKGEWWLDGFASSHLGPRTITLLKGFAYALYPGRGNTFWRLPLAVDAAGVVSSDVTHSGSLGSLLFNTATVSIAPSPLAVWKLPYADAAPRRNPGTVTLIKGLAYTLDHEGSLIGNFAMNAAGTVSPGTVVLGGTTYTLSP